MKLPMSIVVAYFVMMFFFVIGCVMKNHTVGIIICAMSSLTFVSLLIIATSKEDFR